MGTVKNDEIAGEDWLTQYPDYGETYCVVYLNPDGTYARALEELKNALSDLWYMTIERFAETMRIDRFLNAITRIVKLWQ